jgi:hypothetical protein
MPLIRYLALPLAYLRRNRIAREPSAAPPPLPPLPPASIVTWLLVFVVIVTLLPATSDTSPVLPLTLTTFATLVRSEIAEETCPWTAAATVMSPIVGSL